MVQVQKKVRDQQLVGKFNNWGDAFEKEVELFRANAFQRRAVISLKKFALGWGSFATAIVGSESVLTESHEAIPVVYRGAVDFRLHTFVDHEDNKCAVLVYAKKGWKFPD